jgi:TPR repeat protein
MCRTDMTVCPSWQRESQRKEFAGFKNLAEVRAPGRHTAPAQVNLAMVYMGGEGTPRDRGEGMRLLKLAVKSGHAQAQHNLAVMYYNGMHGLPSNAGMAARLYRLAADQGLATSQCNLGGMVANGNSVPQDYVEALRLIRAAAAKQPKAKTVLEQVEQYQREDTTYGPGAIFEVAGIVSSPDLNGQRGRVVASPQGGVAGGRVAVLFEGQTAPKALMTANLHFVTRGSAERPLPNAAQLAEFERWEKEEKTPAQLADFECWKAQN